MYMQVNAKYNPQLISLRCSSGFLRRTFGYSKPKPQTKPSLVAEMGKTLGLKGGQKWRCSIPIRTPAMENKDIHKHQLSALTSCLFGYAINIHKCYYTCHKIGEVIHNQQLFDAISWSSPGHNQQVSQHRSPGRLQHIFQSLTSLEAERQRLTREAVECTGAAWWLNGSGMDWKDDFRMIFIKSLVKNVKSH